MSKPTFPNASTNASRSTPLKSPRHVSLPKFPGGVKVEQSRYSHTPTLFGGSSHHDSAVPMVVGAFLGFAAGMAVQRQKRTHGE
jgi:hypothetical protein